MRHFISAGWPYLYDIPALHNCVPMFFADVFARYHRLIGDEVFFLCGADEFGARTEYVARGYGVTPGALLDEKFDATVPLLTKLGLSFDCFGRTQDPYHQKFVQEFVTDLVDRGVVVPRSQKVAWCTQCQRVWPDRFVEGSKCAVCSGSVEWRQKQHLFFNTVCITRDTSWGIPFLGKSVYSWVDSLLAKISFTAKSNPNYEQTFWKDPDTQRHFFIGQDSAAFYGEFFPALLQASRAGYSTQNWNLHPNDLMLYEGGLCSKSTGTGVWLQEALATLPADLWRFYIFFARDVDFRWETFCETLNQWAIQGFKAIAQAPDLGSDVSVGMNTGEDVERKVTASIRTGYLTQAFQTLVQGLVESPNRAKTARLAPLLTCFLPHAGAELAKGVNPFKMPPLYAPEVQMDYQERVDARRSKRGFEQEITDARADVLCACPKDLEDQ